jgi:hypothetical protein
MYLPIPSPTSILIKLPTVTLQPISFDKSFSTVWKDQHQDIKVLERHSEQHIIISECEVNSVRDRFIVRIRVLALVASLYWVEGLYRLTLIFMLSLTTYFCSISTTSSKYFLNLPSTILSIAIWDFPEL